MLLITILGFCVEQYHIYSNTQVINQYMLANDHLYMWAPGQVHAIYPHVCKINACVREHVLPEIAMHLSTKNIEWAMV